jgi:hypothetical protein
VIEESTAAINNGRANRGKNMTLFWVIGVMFAACVVAFIVLLTRRPSKLPDDDFDLPLWEAEQFQQIDFWPELIEQRDEGPQIFTSPPEWGLPQAPERTTR